MAKRTTRKVASDHFESLPPLPLDAAHWRVIFKTLGLSPQQTRVVDLVLRDAGNQQIAHALGISESVVKTYLQRIFARTGTCGRMQLAMRVLAVSHEVKRDCQVSTDRRTPGG